MSSSEMHSKAPRVLVVLGKLQTQQGDEKEEGLLLSSEAAQISEWWNDTRWKNTKRIYKALDVASLRLSPEARSGRQVSPNCSYSNSSSKKLYSLLRLLHDKNGYSHTFGALDPVQVVQMAGHLTSIYVSGWQSSSTASTTNEPGPDFADYPMNTVPQKVDQLVRAQLFHDRRQYNERSMAILDGKFKNLAPKVDYLTPIIADADTGALLDIA